MSSKLASLKSTLAGDKGSPAPQTKSIAEGATMASSNMAASKPLNALVVGANGYLGSAICRALLRAHTPPLSFFRVHGIVRRGSAAPALAAEEVNPIVGSVSEPEALAAKVLSHSRTWDIVVICTEPSKLSRDAEDTHWRDMLSFLKSIAAASSSAEPPVRPLVLWSSGCKDYGATKLHGDPELLPHTENSPLIPHPLVEARMKGATRSLEESQDGGGGAGFDMTILRATPLFGYTGSYYGALLDYMDAYVANSGRSGEVLKIPSSPRTIIHGIHVDDCADAYVALATTALFGRGPDHTPARSALAGQAFNISGRRYETLQEIAAILAIEYGFTDVAFVASIDELPPAIQRLSGVDFVFGHSQWVDSKKIRAATGWTDSRPLFHENVGVFRRAYDAAKAQGDEKVETTRRRIGGLWSDEKRTT
ncbi:NAD dependent epimerase/dehydratase [Purpureocillium lilacinum]|uniref:NAD dependent epimerase/dehydratase n=2 Tax=Purpureocillium lilacinum TaxID=33203 RepID=A0A179GHQ4_PURLI|nr:NAD dependent epimerase/dehydratase [Purpureocillium lilacinum]